APRRLSVGAVTGGRRDWLDGDDLTRTVGRKMAAGVFGDRVEQFIAKGACELRGDSVRRLRIGVEEIDLGSGGDNAGIRGREGANGHDSVPRSKLPPWVGRLCT